MNMLLLQVDQFACIVCILSALQNHRISPQYVELNVGEKLEIRCKGSLDNAKPFWFFDKFLGALNSHYNRTYSIVRYDSVQLYRSGIYTCVGFKGLFSTKLFFAQSIVKVFGKYITLNNLLILSVLCCQEREKPFSYQFMLKHITICVQHC